MSFRFCTDQKDVAKNVYVVDQELGGGELSLSACAGWGIDLQERKKITNPRGCAVGAWLQAKLNHGVIRRRKTTYVSVDGWMVNFMKYWVASLQ